MTDIRSKKIISTKPVIAGFLGVSVPTLDQFIALGMPVIVINGRIYAHVDALEDWFRPPPGFNADAVVLDGAE